MPDRFTFLFVYDFMSVCERKNPLALIEAFTRAFARGEGPVLVLKSINGDRHLEELERVKLAAAERPDVFVIDRYFARDAATGLMSSCDCYVSLHRAEGFGLTMAEAMVLGKPVIATAYSGNLAFMRDDNAYLVPYRLVPVPEGVAPYSAGGEWAEPDVEHAARLMRHVVEHPEEALERGQRAREYLLKHHSVEVRAELIGQRLAEIRGQRREAPPEVSESPSSEKAEAPAAETRGPSKHELAHSRAREFPASAWDATSRWRPALPAARAALLHLLRPYTASLQAVHAAMLDDALELRERVDRYERERVASLENALSESHAALLGRIRDLEGRVELLTRQTVPAVRRESAARQDHLAERVALLEGQLTRSFAQHENIVQHLKELASDVTGFQDVARAHLASLTERTRFFGESLERLKRELHALPYTAEPIRFEGEALARDTKARPSSDDADFYSGFEAVFRGPEASVRDLLLPYLDLVRHHEPVVDVGCGRGEFLDLLAESGIAASGVDVHSGMVDRCRKKGRRVELADAVDYLSAQPDQSIGCVFSAHFIEHLPFDALLEFFRLSRCKLARGGVLIAETVNPHSVAAMKNFWIDPTHQKPIFPEVALTLCRLHGFESARILFPRGSDCFDDDLWEQGEYAVLARRA